MIPGGTSYDEKWKGHCLSFNLVPIFAKKNKTLIIEYPGYQSLSRIRLRI